MPHHVLDSLSSQISTKPILTIKMLKLTHLLGCIYVSCRKRGRLVRKVVKKRIIIVVMMRLDLKGIAGKRRVRRDREKEK